MYVCTLWVYGTYPVAGEKSDPMLASIRAWYSGEAGPLYNNVQSTDKVSVSNGSSTLY